MIGKKILIIGCSGSGKSTLAKELGEITHMPVIHLDRLFWQEGWKSRQEAEFDLLLREELKKSCWIIDGNYNRTLQERIANCDTIIYLDIPRAACLFNVIKRVIRYKGRTRPDMSNGCHEKIDGEFLAWIWNFNKMYRKKYHELFAGGCGKAVYILKSKSKINNFKKRVSSYFISNKGV